MASETGKQMENEKSFVTLGSLSPISETNFFRRHGVLRVKTLDFDLRISACDAAYLKNSVYSKYNESHITLSLYGRAFTTS